MDSSSPQDLASGQTPQATEIAEAAKRIDNFLLAHSQNKLPDHLAHLQSVTWTKGTSNHGLPYLFGTKDGNPTGEAADAPPDTKMGNAESETMAPNPLPKWVSIFWEVHKKSMGNPDYTAAEQGAQDIGLKDYVITDQGWLMPYELDFHNTSGWFFRFENIKKDFWDITTVLNGHHWLLYYSNSPTLRQVTNRLM